MNLLRALEKLFQLKKRKYKIKETIISFDKAKEPSLTATVELERNDKVQTISSSEVDFFSYVSHLHGIPHIEDDDSDFVYIDNPNQFFSIQEKIVGLFTGELKELVLCERRIDEKYREFVKRIMGYQREWILSEKNLRVFATRLCRIFYDVGVLLIRDSLEEFELIEKDKIQLSDIQKLLDKSKKYDIAECFSAFLLAPKPFDERSEGYDVVIGLITYDLKNRRILSINLNTLAQFQRKIRNIGQYGLWECAFDLFERTTKKDSFKSFLPLPLNIRDFTPLPWFCYAFSKGIQEDVLVNGFALDLPLFLVFGSPLVLIKKPSYIFKPEEQTAFIMLGFREGNEISYHQVRFDVSKGKPELHLDYEIYFEKKPSKKIISHLVVNYEDIWDFSENLAIGFLAASAYDVRFDTMIIPERISGITDAFKKNPLTVYPLFVRSMAGKPYRWLKERPEAIEVLKSIATKKKITNGKKLISELENMNLIMQGRLTILGDIVYARVQQ